MESIQEILSQIEFHTGVDLFKLGQHVKAHGGLSISGTDIWFPDGTATSVLGLDSNRKITFTAGTGITGSGTINTVPKFTAATVIGNSQITDDGTTVAMTNLTVATNLKNTAMTAGSIPFIGAAGLFSQNNANLFWDNANKFLGIGTLSPAAKLHILESTSTSSPTTATPSLLLVSGKATNYLEMVCDSAKNSAIYFNGGTSAAAQIFYWAATPKLQIIMGSNMVHDYRQTTQTIAGSTTIENQAGNNLVTLTISGVANQTTNLQEWKNVASGIVGSVDINGNATFTSGALTTALPVTSGGTGAATFTANSLLLGQGTSAITALGAATNGQLPIGSTGANPVLAVPLGTANQITVATGAGTLTFSTPQDIHTAATPTFAGLTVNGNEGVTGWTKTGDFAGALSTGDIGVKRTGNTFGTIYFETTSSGISGGATFGAVQIAANDAYRFYVTNNGNIVCGSQAALATNATDGFTYIPTCAGTPTGAPTAYTGKSAMVYDTTNFVLYVYAGGAWRTH